jgi:protein SCO1/2
MHKIFALMLACVPYMVRAQIDAKGLVEDVGLDEHLGQDLDLDLVFVNRAGENVRLGDLINGDMPTIIAPVYYSCPGLCTLVLNGVRDSIRDVDLQLGVDYQVVNVSFDPTNTPAMASAKADNYYKTLSPANQRAARLHWYFLTGDQERIAPLMDRLGFRYKKANGVYSHASVLAMISPEGKITRYIAGVTFPPQDVKLALLEASGGKVGSPIDKILTYCFRYDPLAGKYVPWAWGIMRIGGAVTLLVLGIGAVLLRKSELVRKRRLEQNV